MQMNKNKRLITAVAAVFAFVSREVLLKRLNGVKW